MSISEPEGIEPGVELAGLTTFGVGGPASFFVRCPDNESLRRALAWAREESQPVFVLGGGSNLLVAERGFSGLVVQPAAAAIDLSEDGNEIRLAADAGASWDVVVRAAVEAGGAGLEALSGIPGNAGAAPIQNIGAYGQEVAERLEAVELLDRESLGTRVLPATDCGFGYRTSRFKTGWAGRFVVTRLHFRLPRQEEAPARYAELRRHLGLAEEERAPLRTLRQAVLELRRGKSMLFDPNDPDGRSAGSFFLNPVVSAAAAEEVARRYRERGGKREMPRWPGAAPAKSAVKLSAAWLIEEAGFPRGYGEGKAGLSSRHTLAIVNRGGAFAADILAIACKIREGVGEAFGVKLEPEPIQVGFLTGEML
jgi:UDP-N-acetylmuramate dehydrogenase